MAAAEEKMTTPTEKETKDEDKKEEEQKSDKDEVQILEKCESSDQEKTKKRKKDRRRLKFDENGIHILTKQDLCDCLIVNCTGCYMPCPKCSSLKCGHECRRNRKWEYEVIEIQGTKLNIKREQHPPKK